MWRLPTLVGIALLGLALMVGGGVSQEKKDKAKGQLPPGWSKLDLKAEQKVKIYEVQTKYREKIDGLKKQISELENQRQLEMIRVLTDEQKEMLRKLTIGDAGTSDKKTSGGK